MARRPTILTVAEKAGVAPSTVSRYLNEHYVSKEVRKRLAEVIKDLGYSRSATARNLVLQRKGCIGVMVDSTEGSWFNQLLTGLEEELTNLDTSLMLTSLELAGRYDPAIVYKWIHEQRIDGLIVAKSQRRERPIVQAAIEAGIPVAMIGPFETVEHAQIVRCNNIDGGVTVANHLADLGHKRVAFVGGPRQSIDTRHRLRGLQEGLSARGIPLNNGLISYCGSYEAQAARSYAEEFFRRPRKVTAIVVGNDALALGFMRRALFLGIRIPQDLSVVGFDNIPECDVMWPGLTSMAQPMREMGREACRRILDVIDGRNQSQNIEYPMTLVVRESTGPAAGVSPE